MAKTLLKNKDGQVLDLDGAHVLVEDSKGTEVILNQELANLRSTINGLMAASDAMQFKGIVDGDNPLPTEGYLTGWVFKVGVAGTFAGQNCEVGDMVVCIADFDTDAKNTDWHVIQANLDGAVTGPVAAVKGNLAAFDASTGKTIKDSEISMSEAADAVAKKHEHANAEVVDGFGKDTDGNLTYNGNPVGDNKVDCVVINSGEAIPENLRDNGIIFEIQTA